MAYNEIAFHGTIEPYAQNILAEQHFNPSTKPNEWLGYGIYFSLIASTPNGGQMIKLPGIISLLLFYPQRFNMKIMPFLILT